MRFIKSGTATLCAIAAIAVLCTCTRFSSESRTASVSPTPEIPENIPSTAAEIVSPYLKFRPVAYSAAAGVCESDKKVGCAAAGDHIRFDNLNFGTRGTAGLEVTLAVAGSAAGEKIDLRLGGVTGKLLGSLVLTSTGGAATYQMQAGTMIKIKGTQTVALVFPGTNEVGPIEALRFIEADPVGAFGTCPPGAIDVAPGASIPTAVNANPVGASFCLKAGVHRLQSVVPKNNQKFYGENGQTILNGSHLVTVFAQELGLHVATGQTQQGARYNPECIPAQPRCDYPEAFYIDDVPLIAVDDVLDVATGKFFFDYAADKIYFFDDPAGKKVEASVTPQAFSGAATGVTVQGLIVEKYSTPIQWAAISGSGGSGWTIKNNESRLNYAVGISVHSGQMLNNLVHHNGEMGQGCTGTGVLVQNSDIHSNGFFSGLDPLWEGGGMKCAVTTDLVVRGVHSYNNNAMGLWTDIDNVNSLYENNIVEDNTTGGISHEISFSAVMRYNHFAGNGYDFFVWLWGGAIQIQNSQNVEVYGNTIEADTGSGITLIQQDRGASVAIGTSYVTIGNNVHHNVIHSISTETGVGAVADFNAPGMLAGNNIFNSNQYKMTLADDHFWWGTNTYTFSAFKAASGQEAGGTLSAP